MQRPQRWIGLSLILTTLSSCGLVQDLGRRDAARPDSAPPVVHDQPRQTPLQAGENVGGEEVRNVVEVGGADGAHIVVAPAPARA